MYVSSIYISVCCSVIQSICKSVMFCLCTMGRLSSFLQVSGRQRFEPFQWETKLQIDTILLVARWSWKVCFSMIVGKTQPICLGLMETELWAVLLEDGPWNTKKVTPLVAINLSVAFDTVDHDILLSVLEKKFGVWDTCLDWFRSYLNSRFCMVRIRNALSSKCELKRSVPQGSLGGPSLFTVYASTIQSEVPWWYRSAWICWWSHFEEFL